MAARRICSWTLWSFTGVTFEDEIKVESRRLSKIDEEHRWIVVDKCMEDGGSWGLFVALVSKNGIPLVRQERESFLGRRTAARK